MKQPQAIVFGSINMDLAVKVRKLPHRGETLRGNSFSTSCGGKGANQAVALARLGIHTALIGRVGNDNFGVNLRQNLENNGIQIEAIGIDKKESTGIAMIAVEESGENQIIIASGANATIGESDLTRLAEILPSCVYLLLQLEIPLSVVIKAIKIAQKFSIPVILDPAPVCKLPREIYSGVNIITPNAIEASQLVGFAVETIEDADQAAINILAQGVETVIITMDSRGVFCANKKNKFFVPALKVNVVDTVAAGDAFNAGLTTGLVEGCSLQEAVEWGVIAASLSVTKIGAQSSLPSRQEFDECKKNL